MTSNSRRSSWTTRQPRNRPLHSTPCPQVEGALRNSSCLRAHHSRNCRVLNRPLPLPLLPPTPTTATKARVRSRGRVKARTMTPVTPATTSATTVGAPRCGPPSTIPGLAPSRCGQGCVLRNNNRCIHRNTPCSLHQLTMGLTTVPPSCPCRRLHRTSSRPWPLPGRLGRTRGINSYWPTPSTPWS
jgi:hypothetical protein